jgi:excisionase family DNA binding protein
MQQKNLPPLDLNQRYSIGEACAYLRISRAQLYKRITDGSLPTIEDGRRRFVPGHVIAARSRVAA